MLGVFPLLWLFLLDWLLLLDLDLDPDLPALLEAVPFPVDCLPGVFVREDPLDGVLPLDGVFLADGVLEEDLLWVDFLRDLEAVS